MFHSPHSLTILFATETGTAAMHAEWAVSRASVLGLQARAIDMATYNTYRFGRERDLLVIASTHGEGDPPATTEDFFEFLDDFTPVANGLRFAVLALGDSGYERFCAAGKRIDRRLEILGGRRMMPRRDSDVGGQREDREWLESVIGIFANQTCNL